MPPAAMPTRLLACLPTGRTVLAALAMLGCALPAAPAVRAASECAPAQLGEPCPAGGAASMAGDEAALNLGAGNPIHLATGNKTRRDTDLPALAQAPGLEIVRHYNAMDPRAGPLGAGWVLSYDTRLYQRADSIQIVQADGSRLLFQAADGRGDCAALRPGAGRLQRHGAGWRWWWPQGRRLDFDRGGRLAAIVHPSGMRVAITRDAAPGPTQGEILMVADGSGLALRMHYENGLQGARLAAIDTPLGRYEYAHEAVASHWRLSLARRPDGMQRRYLHEAALQGGAPAHALTGVVLEDPAGRAERLGAWAYDARGRVVLATAGGPGDAASRMHLQYRPPGPGREGETRVTTAAGTTVLRIAQAGGRYLLRSVQGPACPGCAAPGSRADYDRQGRLTAVNGLAVERDGQGRVAALAREHGGWPGLRLRYATAPGPGQGRLLAWSAAAGGETRLLDEEGRTRLRRHAGGGRWLYRHDSRGRPVQVHARAARNDTPALSVSLDWDDDSRLVRASHPDETEFLGYDAAGRLQTRRIVRPASGPGGTALAYAERYERDRLGRILHHHLPEGGRLSYAWHGPRLARITWTDAAGRARLLLRAAPTGLPGYEHGNGVRTMGWLQDGRLAGLVAAHPAGEVVFAQVLDYDAAGRIARESVLGAGADGTWTYGYGALSRLAWATFQAADGRPVVRRRFAWREDGMARGTAAPVRDAGGLPARVGDRTLHYDALHRLREVRTGARVLQSQRHNARGQRIERRDAGGSVHYLYTDGRVAAEARTAAGVTGVTRRYVYVNWTPVAMIDYAVPQPLDAPAAPVASDAGAGARVHALHADALGAPRVATDEAGRVRWRADLDALGYARRLGGELRIDLRLPGQVHDPATGWHHNGLRTYDPTAGHYLEPDPLGPLPGTEAYGYAAQQPRRHADPLGLLLYAFDGTRLDAAALGNVWLLAEAYADGAVRYHAGPGTPARLDQDALTAWSAPFILAVQWERLLADLAAARLAAAPAAIDLLGYSRGAALARHFGNLVAERVRGGRFWTRDPEAGVVTACVDLRFMGLFDTVAQFGVLGSGNGAYDLTVADAWTWVAHAVALHEHRGLFPLASLEGSAANAIEAPFVGSHGDIGGGYLAEAGTPAALQGDLSDVALNWMHWQARAAGVPLAELPAHAQRVDRPVVHDERPPGERYYDLVQGADRRVDDAAGDALLRRQADHPRLGAQARRQAEAFIARLPGWMAADTAAAGTVDMPAYRQWLDRELGYPDAP